jgi:hypothetical protein
MRRFIISLCFLLIATPCFSAGPGIFIGAGSGAAALCQPLPFLDLTGGTDDAPFALGSDDDRRYQGIQWTASGFATATKSICKVIFTNLALGGGSLAGITYYAEIWDHATYADPLPANPITNGTSSSCLAGAASCSPCSTTTCDALTSMAFSWSGSYPTVTLGNVYQITISPHATGGANYITLTTAVQSAAENNSWERFKSDKTVQNSSTISRVRIQLFSFE